MRKLIPTRPLTLALLASALVCRSTTAQSTFEDESTMFVYQRSMYLENLLVPGSWWANPALSAGVSSPQFYAANVTPLAGRYVLASARIFFPLPSGITAGIGFLGSGAYEEGSSSTTARNSGFTASGQFLFSEPNIHIGASLPMPKFGDVGALFGVGWETVGITQEHIRRHAVISYGAGYLSPWLAGLLRGSLSMMGTVYTFQGPNWHLDGKAGIISRSPNEVIEGSVEISYSLAPQAHVPLTRHINNYQVLKGLISVQIVHSLAGIAGFSTDLAGFDEHIIGQREDNGNVLHLGAEIRPGESYPYRGGYDVGISTTWSAHVVHRLWFGFSFGSSHEKELPSR